MDVVAVPAMEIFQCTVPLVKSITKEFCMVEEGTAGAKPNRQMLLAQGHAVLRHRGDFARAGRAEVTSPGCVPAKTGASENPASQQQLVPGRSGLLGGSRCSDKLFVR